MFSRGNHSSGGGIGKSGRENSKNGKSHYEQNADPAPLNNNQQYGGVAMARNGSRTSEVGSTSTSLFSGHTNRDAASTLGGATSMSGGVETTGKAAVNVGMKMSSLNLDDDRNTKPATLDNVANEMIDNKTSQRRDTVYEDARENNSSTSRKKTSAKMSRENSSNQSGHASGGGNASVDEWGTRGGAGLANTSRFEQTEAASFVGQDPIAQAGDFVDEEADMVFLSSEMGSGANRQPVTRFRIHSVNLNVHSPVLSEMIDNLADDIDEVRLEEDAATLKLLFGLMYNRAAPALGMNEWQVVLRLARCAQKYNVARAKEVAAAYFTEQEQLGALSPFMTYAFAVQYRLPALEESAAERSTRYDLHRLPELVFNMMGFAAFQQLAAFHSRRQTHYQDVLNNITIDPKELADQCYQTGGVCVVSPLSKLKNKLAWSSKSSRDGSKRPPEPADVLRKLVTEIGQIDCGTCSKALVESALQVQLALESMPSYNESEEAF